MSKILVAIDPGASGGIAWFKPGVGAQALAWPGDMKAAAEIAHEIKQAAIISTCGPTPRIVVYVEKVSGYVKPSSPEDERENRQPGHAMFTFGKNVGAAIMAFVMIGAEIIEVAPVTWQHPLFIKRKKASKADWKRMLRDSAQRRFPGIKVTLKTADALLILSYASLRENRADIVNAGVKPIEATEDATHNLFVASWMGTPTVFRQQGEGYSRVRNATFDDMRLLPTKSL